MNITPTSATWDLGTIYKRAFTLTKQNKKLWILGLAVTVLVVSGSTNSSNSSSSDDRDSSSSKTSTSSTTKEKSYLSYLPFIKQMTQAEVDTAFEQFGYRFMNNVGLSFRSVPVTMYILFGIEVVALAIFFGLVGIAASAWARATLIFGCASVDATNDVSLSESGRIGRDRTKAMIALDYLPWMKVLLLGLLAGVVIMVSAIFNIAIVVAPLVIFAYSIYALIMGIKIIIAQIWAYRFVVIARQSYLEAMLNGKRVAKGHIGSMLILGFLNSAIDIATSTILLLPFGGAVTIALIVAFAKPTPASIVTVIITLIISAIISSPLLTIKSAIFNAFTYLTWHLSFKQFNYSNQKL